MLRPKAIRVDGSLYDIPESIPLSREIFELAMFGAAWGEPSLLVIEARRWMDARTEYRSRQAAANMGYNDLPEGQRPIRTVPQEDWLRLAWPLGD